MINSLRDIECNTAITRMVIERRGSGGSEGEGERGNEGVREKGREGVREKERKKGRK